jgi:MraZ protein
MFLGRFEHSIDDKGRLTIPARYRELLTEAAYLIQGFDGNLLVLPASTFKRLSDRINALSLTDTAARSLHRHFFSTAERLDFDRLGRFLVPLHLRQAADLQSDAMICGAGEYFEIWSPARWTSKLAPMQDPEAINQLFATLDLST